MSSIRPTNRVFQIDCNSRVVSFFHVNEKSFHQQTRFKLPIILSPDCPSLLTAELEPSLTCRSLETSTFVTLGTTDSCIESPTDRSGDRAF